MLHHAGSKEGAGTPSPSTVLGFRPKNVTPEMVETIHNMFPDIPSDNIRFDLLRTGSVQQTSNKILERGFLPPVPPAAYYDIYPRAVDSTSPAQPAGARPSNATAGPSKAKKSENLLTRYHLEGRAETSATATATGAAPEVAGGKAAWEDTAEKREASLRERKAQMILAARQRMLAQQAKEAGSSP
ncbi:hypothetical protein C8Q80DRAFT_1105147 [Daedaleopsis nitida]|nr:hypothetical protein C8Q80DRAFT_1105147 [Daedaleopsis nitida]